MMRRPMLTPAQRALLLSICTAAYGLAVAIATYDSWLKPAPKGQLPGYMTKEGLDAHASFRWFFTLVILPIVSAWALKPVVRLLMRGDTRAWARNASMVALLAGCWFVSLTHGGVLWTALPGLIATIVFVLLRRVDLRFHRRDWILLPAFATVTIGLVDMTGLPVEQAMIYAAAMVMIVRIVLGLRPRSTEHDARSTRLPAAYAFALAPLALFLQTHYLSRDDRYRGWPAIVVALVTPFVLRLLVRNTPAVRRRMRAAITLIIFPIAILSYVSAISLFTAEGRQRVDLFEDSHHLAPGWEVAHGRKPYTDIVPMHGLIEDALLDAALFKWGKPQIGNVLKTRGVMASLLSPAIYFVVFAATGSAETGLLAFFATVAMGFNIGGVRFVPTLTVLAIAIFAVRRRNLRALAWAGGMTVIAGLTALDGGFYCAVITVAAMILVALSKRQAPGARRFLPPLLHVTIGVVAVFLPAITAMAIFGFAGDFFRVTLTEIANLGPVYSQRPMGGVPPAFDKQFPDVLASIFDARSMQYLAWLFAMAFVAIALTYGIRGRERMKRRIEPLFLCALFIVIHGVSYAERQHIYFHFVIPASIVIGVSILLRRRSTAARMLGVGLAFALFVAANVTIHAVIDAALRRTRLAIDPHWTVVGLPAAQNALFLDEDVRVMDTVNRWCLANMAPDDTFYDFTDHTILHVLLNRRIPVRQIEVATCESERLQREVIGRLARNPHVKAVIVSSDENSGVDGVPNWVRAPLVWEWIQQNFEPAFAEGKLVIWKRRV